MITLAIASVRHRLPSFTATFAAVFLSTLVVGMFATLGETSLGPVSEADQETLLVMGAVIGSWGALIALFALVSTLSIAVQRRSTEIGLLRSIGATPRQARRLVRAEVLTVGAVAAAAGSLAAWPCGALLLGAIRDGGMVAPTVEFSGGAAALGSTAAAVLGISVLAASIASLRATRAAARLAVAGEQRAPRLTWWRLLIAVVLMSYAIGLGFLAVFVLADTEDPYAAMGACGSSAILAATGLAMLGAPLLGGVSRIARPVLGVFGTAGHLAGFNTCRRPHLLSGILGPVIVLTAAATGVLMLVGIDARTLVLPPGITQAQADTVTLLNNVVVGMIALFAALLTVNAILAVIGDRRAEFGRLLLVGASPEQLRSAVFAETLFTSGVGVALGVLASLATVVPFSIARGEGVVPDGQLWIPLAIGAAAMTLSVAAATVASRRALAGGSVTDVVAAT